MKPKPTPKLPSPGDPPSTRFAWVLHVVFGGSQGEMANALNCSQSIISRFVRGRQEPGAKLLMTLADHPALNRAWVLTGEGEPLAAQVANYEGDAALPIAREPFIGLPYNNPLCLDDVLCPVPRKLHRCSRYCFRMNTEHPFANDGKLKITSDDVVVFDPNENEWPDNFLDRPCLVQVNFERDRKLVFCRCGVRDATNWTSLDFDMYKQLPDSVEDVNDLTNDEDQLYGNVDLRQDPKAQSERQLPIQLVAVAVYRLGPI